MKDADQIAVSELTQAADAWAAAILENDADRIGGFMSDDWVIVSERGVSPKEEFLAHVRSGRLTHSKFQMVGDARVKIYDEAAVLTCRVVDTAHFGGQTFEADEWTSDVFVKQAGRWLCVLSHITPAAREP